MKERKFEIAVVMNTGQSFTFLVNESQICRDGYAQKYLEKEIARKRVKERKISGYIVLVENLTLKAHRSQSKVSIPWYG